MKVSLLIFSRDAPQTTVDLSKDLSDSVDEIVIIDSSVSSNHKTLKELSRKWKKIRAFRVLALGYVEPYRAYGLSLCKNDWVLYLDTDERLSPKLKSNMKRLIAEGDADAYSIKRYERAHLDGTKDSFNTWQTRLYNRKNIVYKGIIHEQPLVNGTLAKIEEEDCYMLHIAELRQGFAKEYSRLDMFERLSYDSYNRKMLSYLSKFMVTNKDLSGSIIGRMITASISFSAWVHGRKKEDEIADIDYYVMNLLRITEILISAVGVKFIFYIIPQSIAYVKRIKKLQNEDKDNRNFKIAQIIDDIGIVRYLKLDDHRVVETLNVKYGDRKPGVDLLLHILYKRYENRYP